MDLVTLAMAAAMGGGGGGGSSGGGVLVVHDVDGTLDKTWQEIHDACLQGPAFVLFVDSGTPTVGVVYSTPHIAGTDTHEILAAFGPDLFEYDTDINTGYPQYVEQN